MKRPNGCKADLGAPIFAAISAIGFRRAARAISMSDRMNQRLPLDPRLAAMNVRQRILCSASFCKRELWRADGRRV